MKAAKIEKGKRRRSTIIYAQHLAAPGAGFSNTWDNAPVWVNQGEDTLWDKGTAVSMLEPDEKGGEWEFDIEFQPGDVKKLLSKSSDKNNLEYQHVKRRDVTLAGADIDDMTSLLYLNEPELLECLRQRFEQKLIYTSIGPILLAVNPFERLSIYTAEVLDSYYNDGSSPTKVRPHVFTIANRAYHKMFVDKFRPDERENQAILVNGESGAGETRTHMHKGTYS